MRLGNARLAIAYSREISHPNPKAVLRVPSHPVWGQLYHREVQNAQPQDLGLGSGLFSPALPRASPSQPPWKRRHPLHPLN